MPKAIIEYIVKSLVEHPNKVALQQSDDTDKIGMLVTVDERDLGRVIGKDGKTIRALRTVASVFGPARKEITVDVSK